MSKETERNESLRTEYLSIAEKLSVTSTRNWQAMAFLIGGSYAAAGLMASRMGSGQDHGFISFILTVFLGIAIGITLHLFLRLQLSRDNWRIRILYKREREIEKELELYASHYIYWLDELRRINERKSEKEEKEEEKELLLKTVPQEKEQTLRRLEQNLRSPGVTGNLFIDWATRIAIMIWPVFISIQFFRWQWAGIINCDKLKEYPYTGLIVLLLLIGTELSVYWKCRSIELKEDC